MASKFERTRNQKIGATLENGWYVIVDLSEHLQKQNDLLAKLSEKTCVLVGSIEEHVMDARVTCWQNGKKVWAVIHNAETSDQHLQVEGTPPADLKQLKTRHLHAKYREAPSVRLSAGSLHRCGRTNCGLIV
ncbi:MAG: hypothetical protein IPI39_20965 [Candidatus Obscuribacter sp.]|nr:hypothetical protein [Candidatus Obscuribacter sp.]